MLPSLERGPVTDARVKPTRRKVLKATLAASALLVAGSTLAVFRARGYDLPPDRASKLVALSPWQLVFVTHLARRIAAPDRPGDPTIPTTDEVDVAGFIDGYVARMPAALRRDLFRAFVYVEHVAPLRLGLAWRFTRLAPEDQDRVLAALESSGQDLLRGAFDGLKSLVFMGYYRDARTWKILGYDGPLIHRPEGGWVK
jgi:hypothetical protein